MRSIRSLPVLSLALTLFLASCTVPSDAPRAEGGDRVSVDYVGTFSDGKMFDTSLEEEAKTAGIYQTGRVYTPLAFTLAAGEMIPGFDDNVTGMASGETKTFTVPPEKAYGLSGQVVDVPLSQIADTITEVVPRSAFDAVLTQEVASEQITARFGEVTVGQVLDLGNAQTGSVKSIGSGSITLSINNTINPFSGKKLAVGLKGTLQNGANVEITALTDSEVTLLEDNLQNPFYGKPLAVGLSAKLPDEREVSIVSLSESGAQVEIKGPMVGKTLTFKVTVRSLEKKAAPAAVASGAATLEMDGVPLEDGALEQ